MMKRALLALLFLAATAAAPQERYVPAEGWRDTWQADFYEEWFGGQLRAMAEPILSRPGDLGHFRQRFRLMILPTFQHGYAIRIDETALEARVRIVQLSGRGGYSPGHVASVRTLTLDRAGMAEVDRLIADARLAGEAPDASPPGDVVNADGSQTITICADGTEFVFELVNRSGSHFVARHDCTINRALLLLANDINRIDRD